MRLLNKVFPVMSLYAFSGRPTKAGRNMEIMEYMKAAERYFFAVFTAFGRIFKRDIPA